VEREPYITIPNLVKRGGIPLGETTLYQLAKAHKIRSYKVGRKVLVLESEVHEDIRKFNMKVIYGRTLVR